MPAGFAPRVTRPSSGSTRPVRWSRRLTDVSSRKSVRKESTLAPDSPEESAGGDFTRTLKIYTLLLLDADEAALEESIGPLSDDNRELCERLKAEIAQSRKDHPDWIPWIPWDG